ncbi:MAG TPA: hypothetical protein VD963_02735, partial [Phycisphaerales bacterium]|nr:hypothetical protein [Phycisphaerales bacterium]
MTQPQTEHDAPRAGRSRARDRLAWRGAQLAGFAAGLALLAWVARGALADTGAAELRRLWRAGPGAASALLALSGLSILLTGAMFWAAVRPARPLRFWGVQAVNVIAFILALAPLKIGAIFRVLAHHRLDRLPLLTIGAWFIVVALIMAGVLVPMGLASLWRTRIDGAWLAASASGAAALLALMWLSARQGRAHLEAALLWSAGRAGARARGAVELRLLPRLREGAVMAGAG